MASSSRAPLLNLLRQGCRGISVVQITPGLVLAVIQTGRLPEDCMSIAVGTRFGSANLSWHSPNGDTVFFPPGTPHAVEHASLFVDKFIPSSVTIRSLWRGADGNGRVDRDRTSWWGKLVPFMPERGRAHPADILRLLLEALSCPSTDERVLRELWNWAVGDIRNELEYRNDNFDYVIRQNLLRTLWPDDDLGADPIGDPGSLLEMDLAKIVAALSLPMDTISSVAVLIPDSIDIPFVVETLSEVLHNHSRRASSTLGLGRCDPQGPGR